MRVTRAAGAMAALCLASVIVLVVLGTRLTFFNDDWYFLLQRPGLASGSGLDAFLEPHNGNMVVLLMLPYRVFLGLFGMGAQLPFRLLSALSVCALGLVVFWLVADRLGSALGVGAAAIILFLGPAWEALLFFNAVNHVWAVTVGLAAIGLLERDTRRRNLLACLLLVAGVCVVLDALPMVVGAAVMVLLRRRLRQLWIVAVPIAVFGVWYLAYGDSAPSTLSAGNLGHLPRYVFDSLSRGLASITGVAHSNFPIQIFDGHVVAVIALAAGVIWIWKRGWPRSEAMAFAAAALAFWVAAGMSATPGRGPDASRYQIVDGAMIIVFIAELVRGIRLSRTAVLTVLSVVALIVISNVDLLHAGYQFMRQQANYAEADLGALRIAGPRTRAGFRLTASIAHNPFLTGVTTGRYFVQTARFGSPAYNTPAQLRTATLPLRQAADSVLSGAEVTVGPAPLFRNRPSCRGLTADDGAPGPATTLPAGATLIHNPDAALMIIGVSRFAPAAVPDYVGFVPSHASVTVRISADSTPVPWQLSLRGVSAAKRPAAVCP